MKKNSFATMLNKINNKQLINIAVFINLAEELSLSETTLRMMLRWTKAKGKNYYSVDIIDNAAFDSLLQQYPIQPVIDRVSASIAGNSHRQRVSGSLLSILPYGHSFPQLLLFAQDGTYKSSYPLHHHLLVIENMENFLALIKQPDYLAQWLDHDWPCDIVYAQGNAIGNKLHQQFFAQYDKILCLLDIDPGGFEIFKNIHSMCNADSCHYVISDYYLQQYLRFGNALTQQQRSALEQGIYPEALQKIISIVLQYNYFAEQEILLWE